MISILKHPQWTHAFAVTAVVAVAVVITAVPVRFSAAADQPAYRPPTCRSDLPPTPPPLAPTTIDTVGEAYRCLLDHYVAGNVLDGRTLLAGAFAGFSEELHRRGLDRTGATLPALTGDRDRDWAAVRRAYQRAGATLHPDATVRQALAEATLRGMITALHDNHVRWLRPVLPPGAGQGQVYGLGIGTSPDGGLATSVPAETVPPLFVTDVLGGPAARNGLRPGDLIESVNGSAPYANGQVSPGVLQWLNQQYPQRDTVRLELRRPSTGRTWTVTMQPETYRPDPAATQQVTSRRLTEQTGYVRLRQFGPHAADQVRQAATDPNTGGRLRGLVLDLRGNHGGDPTEVARLLGAFVHGRTWSYSCGARYDHCTPNRTDDTVPLLRLRLVVLTDRGCASACDAFSGAVRDLRIGQIVGTRTAGIVSGPASAYLLSDGSRLGVPARHELSADREIINGIGVAVDRYVPLTATDLSAGRDPAVTTALDLLGG